MSKTSGSILDQLADKVLIGDGCWGWNAAHNHDGYGRLRRNRKEQKVHRIVYELLQGPIPAGMTLDHLCRNRGCVRPSHMEVCTQSVNASRQIARLSKLRRGMVV